MLEPQSEIVQFRFSWKVVAYSTEAIFHFVSVVPNGRRVDVFIEEFVYVLNFPNAFVELKTRILFRFVLFFNGPCGVRCARNALVRQVYFIGRVLKYFNQFAIRKSFVGLNHLRAHKLSRESVFNKNGKIAFVGFQ